MLKTKSVKFSAVKKHFPRAHIEITINKTALEKYVHKTDTRIAELQKTKCATVGDLNRAILELYPVNTNKGRITHPITRIYERYKDFEIGICLLDEICNYLMSQGYFGVEYICSNPSVRTTWKKYWEGIVRRQYASETRSFQEDQEIGEESASKYEEAPDSATDGGDT